jgi:peptide chain release factor 1
VTEPVRVEVMPLLQLPHLGRERRLVADRARHPAEQRRHLGARLDEAEDVVDEEEDVLALVAEVLRHRQAREADAQRAPGGSFIWP